MPVDKSLKFSYNHIFKDASFPKIEEWEVPFKIDKRNPMWYIGVWVSGGGLV